MSRLDRFIAESWCADEDSIRFDAGFDAAAIEGEVWPKLEALAESIGVKIERSGGAFPVKALGQTCLDKAVVQLSLLLRDEQAEYRRLRDAPPSSWQDQLDDDDIQLFVVPQGSAEWTKVEAQVNSHGFGATVVKVERVQAPGLWAEYAAQRQKIGRQNGGDFNEQLVKHGTSGTDPLLVARSPMGIDPRYSAPGRFGRGAYFAEEASYSHSGYTYAVPGTQDHQMFLCRIAAGRVEERKPDANIKHPSPGFHSVRGPLHKISPATGTNQFAFILYEFYQSYPEYLVTYSGGKSV
jgi:hypothetical protein